MRSGSSVSSANPLAKPAMNPGAAARSITQPIISGMFQHGDGLVVERQALNFVPEDVDPQQRALARRPHRPFAEQIAAISRNDSDGAAHQ